MVATVARSVRFASAILLLFVLSQGCAQGEVTSGEDAGQDSGPGPMSDAAAPQDTGAPDSSDKSTGCGMCCPGEQTCVSDTALGICRADGSGFDATDCPEGEECSNGVCVAGQVCTPGEASCFDETTILMCRMTGEGFVTMPCSAGLACFEGECISGEPAGATCDSDDICASGTCHCGAGTGEMCPDLISTGYCTKPCNVGDCGENGACLAADEAPFGVATADYDHCVRSCDAGECEPAGLACVGVPVRTSAGLVFQNSCYFDGVAEIGAECTNDVDCIGTCLTDYFSGQDGYCSRRCDDDGVCPEGSECVELRPEQFWCSVHCGDGTATGTEDCPFDALDRFDVTCKIMSTQQGGVSRVCAST